MEQVVGKILPTEQTCQCGHEETFHRQHTSSSEEKKCFLFEWDNTEILLQGFIALV